MSDVRIGHNTPLKGYVDRLINLMEERSRVMEDIRELKKEAKSNGIESKPLADIVKMKLEDKKAREKREKLEEIKASYLAALGMLE